MKKLFTIVFAVSLCSCASLRKSTTDTPMPEAIRIWDRAPHNAFTDLLRFRNAFYCVFREASAHVYGTDGKIQVLRSADGKSWHSIAVLEKAGTDLRDPKISVTPQGKLMILMGGSVYRGKVLVDGQTHVSFSDETGSRFSAPRPVKLGPGLPPSGNWIWRVTWHKGTGYAIDYQAGTGDRKDRTACYLLRTTDGQTFERMSRLEVDGFPNESTIRFDQHDEMYVLIRRDLGDQKGVLARSRPPYRDWAYQKLDIRLGGPNFIFLGKDRICMASRLYASEGGKDHFYTALFVTDTLGRVRKTVRLPSGGDNSYPGLVSYRGKLWVSYYSSHEKNTAIYLARVPLKELR
ncbi:hypothetical protein [Compostibacter hankyongensis]|uniref:Sialidase family protein n=1 Tax=Compostibacter hankyongensis TaxID=1007089 RepID=A0ABP8FZU8_9BACT